MKLTLEKAKIMMERNGGSLVLSGTGITTLPDNLTVGGYLDLRGTGITNDETNKVNFLRKNTYIPKRYLYADGILTHVRGVKKIDGCVFYIGKIPGRNVVSDGVHYAHCDKLRDGLADLAFKTAKDRGADQYKSLSLDSTVTIDEAVTMYRVITGACKQGSQAFVDSLGDRRKDNYTIRECIELTKGQYNATTFERFFMGN